MPESRKRRLQRLLEAPLHRVDEDAWKMLLGELAPISPSYLRTLLDEAGVPVDPPWCGVRQHTFDELAASLTALEREYTNGDAARRRLCRDLVIEAKARARRVMSSATAAADTRERKGEMIEWMLVWLENPGVFPVWVELRRR